MRPMTKIAGLLIVALGTAFAQVNPAPGASTAKAFALTSPAFAAGGEIPAQYTCKGPDTSPPLEWSGAPANAAGFALIVEDPDAPEGIWVHWMLWNLPPATHSLPQGLPRKDRLDDGSLQGRNDFRKVAYNGPCPPSGATHRYFFRLYALDSPLDLGPKANRAGLDAAMKGHVLAQSEYMGTFHK